MYALDAGQKLGIEGFAGFSSFIKEFGYYFDGNAEGAVWGILPEDPNVDAKKKAGEKARLFDIDADTAALTNGEHTVTFAVKFLNNKTCDLITLDLNVGGSAEGSSESGEIVEGCSSSIAFVGLVPIVAIFGAVMIKKKED